MEEYKPNSHKSKENNSLPEKKVEKIISGSVKTKKKSAIGKFANAFIQEDAQSVKSYIFMEVLIPALKKALSDIVKSAIDMFLYGESGKSKRNGVASRVSYRSYYDDRDERRAPRPRAIYDYNDIVLEDRGEAEEVLDRLNELIDVYQIASVADLYDLVGEGEQSNYTDNKYGWTDLRSASVVRVRDGYLLKLPRALPLN